MGQLISHPVEEKTIDFHTHESLTYCIGSMQGYRMTMEDAHDVRVAEDEQLAVFGVFDGHGGREIAELLRDRLVATIFRKLNVALRAGTVLLRQILRLEKDCFFQVDSELPEQDAANCGSTAVVATLVARRYIVVANSGDLRAILSLPGGLAKNLLFDHKPSTMGERVRIENSGGFVANSRVNEILALLRAFGDFKFKMPWLQLSAPGRNNSYLERNRKHIKDGLMPLPPELFQVSVEPDLMVYDLAQLAMPEFMVLACDGIWDCYTNDQLVQLIRGKLAYGWDLRHITEYILNDCISMASANTGVGFDNMTLMIVALHPDSSMEEWAAAMEKRIAQES